jgi:hypothetical protein
MLIFGFANIIIRLVKLITGKCFGQKYGIESVTTVIVDKLEFNL